MNRKPVRRAITFQTALEGYWLARGSSLSKSTRRDYTLTFSRFSEYIGDRPLADITAADIQRFLDKMCEVHKLGKKTVSNLWVALSSFWTWAAVELNVAHVIHGRVRQPEYRAPVIQIYSEVEIKAMLHACQETNTWQSTRRRPTKYKRSESLRDQAIITTLVDTGVRASELCNFQMRDYIQAQGRLMVREGKWGKDRVVFLGQAGRRTLWRYLVTRSDTKPNDPLFATNTGTAIERNNLRKTLQRIGERAGVLDVTVHRFRHTFAVNFLRNGGNVLELQEMLGHERMDTVRIYAKLAEVDLAAAQQRSSVADNWRL